MTNAQPGVPIVFRVERDGAERDVTVTPEVAEQGGRTVGIAGHPAQGRSRCRRSVSR